METDKPKPYFRRLLSRTWRQTMKTWELGHWEAPLADGVFALLVAGATAVGSGLNLWVLINGIGAGIVGFLMSLVISLFRSPKLLDDERAGEIDKLRSERDALRAELQIPRIPPDEQERRHIVKDKLRDASLDQIGLLRYMAQHGGTINMPTMNKWSWNVELNTMMIARLVLDIPVPPGVEPRWEQIRTCGRLLFGILA